jgi:gliding motility-associated-like protein
MKILLLFFIIFSSFSSQKLLAQVNLNAGLVGYYPFTGNANDVSGNNNNGLTRNGVQLSSDRFGNANSAYYFDGIDDYIKVPDNGSFSTPNMSLVIWFQTESNDLQVLVGKRKFEDDGTQGGGAQYQFFINYPPFPGIGSNLVGSNSSCSFVSNSSYINTNDWICSNKWYMAVITFDGSRHKIYIDGVLKVDVATSFPSMLLCNSELRFGNWWSGGTLPFKGKLDDIRWYNRPLNQDEITALYDNFSGAGSSSSDFSFSQNACNPNQIFFLNNTPNTQNQTWYFGDGNTSTSNNPVHSYNPMGNYSVKLLTTNTYGCADSISKQITIDISRADIISSSDTSICLGQSVLINTLATSDFCWTNTTSGLNNTSIPNPVATPIQTTTYYFNAKQRGANVIANGDFSSGNSGFSSDYILTNPNVSEGQYFVGTSPQAWNSSMGSCHDHTSGAGNMMMVNGSPQPNVKVWCETVAVTPNTNYEFSAWVQSIYPDNPAQIQFSINGIQLGSVFSAATICNWSSYNSSWNSGTNIIATVCIENKNTISQGNDFALDDIVLAPVYMRYDSVKITVLPKPPIWAGNDTLVCVGQAAQLNATGGTVYSWTPSTGLSNTAISNPVATPASTTQYIVSGYTDPGCVVKDTVQVNVVPQPVFSITPPSASICKGDIISFTSSGGDTYQWYTNSQPGLSSSNSYSASPLQTDTFYVALDNLTCGIKDTLQSIITVNPLPVVSITKSNDIDCATPDAQLVATGGVIYQWSPVTNITDPSIANPVVYPATDTWYKVTVTNADGCSKTDSVLVHSDYSVGQNGFFVPNSFTPNGDGLNDCFGVRFWGRVDNFELSIYNRWGQRIYFSKNIGDCWDGTFKGEKQPSGGFVFQIKASSPCSAKPIYRKGVITLIR